jgi:hypothetical protein
MWFGDDVGGSGAFPMTGNAASRALLLGEGCAVGWDAAANWALALADGSCGLVGLAGSVLLGANDDSPYDVMMTSFEWARSSSACARKNNSVAFSSRQQRKNETGGGGITATDGVDPL